MARLDDLLQEFPEGVQETIRQVWGQLSAEQRREFERLAPLMPGSMKPLREIAQLIADHYRAALGRKRQIAIVGPANVGKSTLYNQLILRSEDRADVGPIPGTTRRKQEGDSGLFSLIDTPGADAAGDVGEQERQIAFAVAAQADFLIIVFEATRGIKRYEKELFEALQALHKPYLVVLNKMDLIGRADRSVVHQAAATNLHLDRTQVIDTVASEGQNVGRLVLAVAKAEPQLLAALAQALPEYQSRLAWQRILSAAGLAGTVGLTPLPFVDLIPLLAIQVGLVLTMARIYGYKLTPKRGLELIATFGAGLVGRTAFQELSKMGGVPGWVLSATIAATTTVVIGYASQLWFAYGEKPSQAKLRRQMTEVSLYLREQLAELGRHRPSRKTFRRRLSEILQELPGRLRQSSHEPDVPANGHFSEPDSKR